jgi:pilus assembly protein CpaF
MAMMGEVTLPEKAIRAQIASAVDLIVQVSRMSDGTRRVTHISEITGTSGDVISLQDIYLFEKLGLGPAATSKAASTPPASCPSSPSA